MDKTIYTLIEFLSGTLAFLFLVITFLGISNYTFDQNTLKMYKDNWKVGPIIDIISLSKDTNCPTDYETLISNSFPGNKEGCDCYNSESISYTKKIFTDKCSKGKLDAGCLNVEKVDNTTLKTWKGKNICIKRMKKTFFDLMGSTAVKSCPSGKKKCGIFDSENNILCLNENEQCPINFIEIKTKTQKPSIDTNDIETVDLSKDYVLYFSNKETDNKIYTQIIANTHDICFEPNDGYMGQNFYQLNLFKGESECKIKYKNQKSLYDNRFSAIDKESSVDFFIDNNLLINLNKLSNYPYPKEGSEVSLYGTNFFGWNQKCFRQSKSLFTEQKLIEPNTKKSFDFIYVTGIISFMYLFFLIGCFALFCMIEDSQYKKQLFLMIDCIKILIAFSIFILSIITITKNVNLLKPFKEFRAMKCGDDITTNALKLSYRHLLSIHPLLSTIAFFSIFDVFVITAYYIFFYFLFKSKK